MIARIEKLPFLAESIDQVSKIPDDRMAASIEVFDGTEVVTSGAVISLDIRFPHNRDIVFYIDIPKDKAIFLAKAMIALSETLKDD